MPSTLDPETTFAIPSDARESETAEVYELDIEGDDDEEAEEGDNEDNEDNPDNEDELGDQSEDAVSQTEYIQDGIEADDLPVEDDYGDKDEADQLL